MAFKMKGFEPYTKVKGNNKPDGRAGSSAFQKADTDGDMPAVNVSPVKRTGKEKRRIKRDVRKNNRATGRADRKKERETTGISRAEQFAKRAEKTAGKIAKSRIGRLAGGAIKLATDAKNTDVGRVIGGVKTLAQGNVGDAYNKFKGLSKQIKDRRKANENKN
tara:strand:+ start:293 stop:781 length:489 start_codon:yes stop_codon:yes gene_type:complete